MTSKNITRKPANSLRTALLFRIENCTMFGVYKIDGYICQSLNPTRPSPSDVLSDYLGKDAHLVMKGPRTRVCLPTPTFPELKANHVFQVRLSSVRFLLTAWTDRAGLGRVSSASCQRGEPVLRWLFDQSSSNWHLCADGQNRRVRPGPLEGWQY